MQAANDNTLTRLQLEINRALHLKDTSNLIDYISRYMKAADMEATETMLENIPRLTAKKLPRVSQVN